MKTIGIKMAKASQLDLDTAMEIAAVLEQLGQRWCPSMPEAIQQPAPGHEVEPFDSDDREQCQRALEHLLGLASRASLFRVVMGMAVLLDPRNQVVDPGADTLEIHPDLKRRRTSSPGYGDVPGDAVPDSDKIGG